MSKNYLYEKIVEKDSDFIGIIAYHLYKKEKLNYIKNHKLSKNNQEPTTKELLDFQFSKAEDKSITHYRQNAELLMKSFVNSLLTKEREKIDSEIEKNQKEVKKIKERETLVKEREKNLNKREQTCHVKAKKSGYWVGVSQGLLSTFIYMVICLIILYFYNKEADILGKLIAKLNQN